MDEDFIREVETRIPLSRSHSGSSKDYIESSFQSFPLTSEAFPIQNPITLLDVSTQTSPSSPTLPSRASSITWLSECEYDGASLEMGTSSLALSGTEDDLDDYEECEDEDDWWLGGSLSSSPPATPASLPRDDSSLSLSESLDTLDINGESGIGTVSTRPSTSPQAFCGPLDLSGSNLSSEDTGLETSFEKRVRRFLPNSRANRGNSVHATQYRRRRTRPYVQEQWVRRENQMTQTDVNPPTELSLVTTNTVNRREVRASSEECDVSWRGNRNNENGYQQKNMRHTHSEPRLTEPHQPQPILRGVSSEAALPPLPHSHPRQSASSVSTLPTLSEDSNKPPRYPPVRPRHLPLGQPHSAPAKTCSAPILDGISVKCRSSATTPSEESSGETPVSCLFLF